MTIKRDEFARRRKNLMTAMGQGSIAVIPAAEEKTRNRDVDYPFRQDSDFWYATGFPEPDAVAVLIPGRPQGEYVLFCRDKDQAAETWTGFRYGPDGAVNEFDADDAFPIDDIDDILPGLLEGRTKVYYDIGRDGDFDLRIMDWVNRLRAKVRMGGHPPGEFQTLNHLLHEMRLFKSAAEVKLIRRAGEISAAAHVRAMKAVKPGLYEYQLEAEYLHEFMHRGARTPAYPSIVGGGKNACVLHYIENSSKLKFGDLVLVDAAGELDNYASDITRTYPVNGKFSAAQQALYEVVLAAQLAAIDKVKPEYDWNAGHETAVTVLTQGLKDLGLLQGDVSELVETGAYRSFYMHRTGHWMGLDVHDVGDYKVDGVWRQLEPGMVLTVEPGLYIAPNAKVDEKWRGIGIRIEDDVLVTAKGADVLTSDVPKTIADIEQLMAQE